MSTNAYTLTPRDYYRFILFIAARHWLVPFVAVALTVLFMVLLPWRSGDTGQNIVLFVISMLFIGLLIGCILGPYLYLMAWLMCRRQAVERTVAVSESGIHDDSVNGRQDVPWAQVHKIGRTQTHLFLQHSAREASIVPRRALDNDSAWLRFATLCEQHGAADDLI